MYLGGSLGGYIGMECVGRHPDLFSAAVISQAAQNVGVGRSLKASLGLALLKTLASRLSNKTLLTSMLSEFSGLPSADPAAVLQTKRTGLFFQAGAGQVAILEASNPPPSLARFPGRVLFLNGSEDHRDSEQSWLKCCSRGQSILYPGGNHFFTHDTRFDVAQDVLEFLKENNETIH